MHWRMRAEKMRTLAEETNDPTVRAMMLRFAATYDRVAGQAADPAQQDSIMFRRGKGSLKASLRAALRHALASLKALQRSDQNGMSSSSGSAPPESAGRRSLVAARLKPELRGAPSSGNLRRRFPVRQGGAKMNALGFARLFRQSEHDRTSDSAGIRALSK